MVDEDQDASSCAKAEAVSPQPTGFPCTLALPASGICSAESAQRRNGEQPARRLGQTCFELFHLFAGSPAFTLTHTQQPRRRHPRRTCADSHVTHYITWTGGLGVPWAPGTHTLLPTTSPHHHVSSVPRTHTPCPHPHRRATPATPAQNDAPSPHVGGRDESHTTPAIGIHRAATPPPYRGGLRRTSC